jgi:hypothetical protein
MMCDSNNGNNGGSNGGSMGDIAKSLEERLDRLGGTIAKLQTKVEKIEVPNIGKNAKSLEERLDRLGDTIAMLQTKVEKIEVPYKIEVNPTLPKNVEEPENKLRGAGDGWFALSPQDATSGKPPKNVEEPENKLKGAGDGWFALSPQDPASCQGIVVLNGLNQAGFNGQLGRITGTDPKDPQRRSVLLFDCRTTKSFKLTNLGRPNGEDLYLCAECSSTIFWDSVPLCDCTGVDKGLPQVIRTILPPYCTKNRLKTRGSEPIASSDDNFLSSFSSETLDKMFRDGEPLASCGDNLSSFSSKTPGWEPSLCAERLVK